MTRRPVIAIDGPAGSGKSTLGRGLAAALGLPYINTGQMYRAVTARALASGTGPDDAEALAAIAAALRFDLDQAAVPPDLRIDGRPPGDELVDPEVEATVSRVSRHPAVRAVLAEEQRRLGRNGAVMEGRDIATVVFPDADVKLFVHAAPVIRAARRAAERRSASPEELARRDALDARTNPLEPAEDAVVVSNEGRTPDEVLAEALSVVRRRLEEE